MGRLFKKKKLITGQDAANLASGSSGQENSKKTALKKVLSKRNALLVGIVAIVLTGAIIGVLLVRENFSGDDWAAMPCSERAEGSILLQASQALDAVDPERLDQDLPGVVERIKAEPNNQADPNCLYPLIRYHMHVGDFEAAKSTFQAFESIHSQETFDSELYMTNIDTIRSQVEFLDVLEEQAGSNSILFGPPVEPEEE